MPAWLGWLIAAGVLVGIELVSLHLLFVMLAGGALAAAAAAWLGAPVVVQAMAFAVVSLALLFVVRPAARRRLQVAPVRSGTKALEGRSALVVSTVDSEHGQVKIGGEVWTARAYDRTQTLRSGEEVQVMEIKGATALVWRGP